MSALHSSLGIALSLQYCTILWQTVTLHENVTERNPTYTQVPNEHRLVCIKHLILLVTVPPQLNAAPNPYLSNLRRVEISTGR